MSRNGNILKNLDWTTIFIFLGLTVFGWLNIYGASYNFEQSSIFDFSNRAGKQFVWIISALFLGSIILLIDAKTYDILAYILYAIMIVVLLITPLLAHNVKGSYSWISVGPISMQPAEFAKCITALALAKYMGRYEYHYRGMKDLYVPFVIIGLPMVIIMILQQETGTALVFAAFLLVFYRQGMSGLVLWGGILAAVVFVVVIRFSIWPALILLTVCFGFMAWRTWRIKRYYKWLVLLAFIGYIGFSTACDFVFTKILQPHQRVRIEVLLGMTDDPSGVGYNVAQSMIAIGSGRFLGKGYLQGTQTKLHFVPEQDTDFIFCTVGEEWGFVGSAGVLIIYLIFILRLIRIAERQRDNFSQIYCYSVACIFMTHMIINVGMVLGLLPVIGIPLPFFSYGGSSMVGFTILLFILLKLDATRVEKLH